MAPISAVSDHYRRPSPVTGDEIDPLDEVRYYGIPTLLRAPIAESLEGLDVALVGVPFDAGATNRPGARHGPWPTRWRPGSSGSGCGS